MNSNTTKRAQDLGFEIVASLLERQDQVLEELDQLNEKIEAMIKSLNPKRDENDGRGDTSESEPESAIELSSRSKKPTEKRKAA